jgi:hypothetical protein
MRLLISCVLLLWSVAQASAEGRIESSEGCGSCHRTIHRAWLSSAHARSLENETFLAAFRQTEARDGSKQARVCLGCHAPITVMNDDTQLSLRTTWEGVSCDVCHSLVSVELTPSGPRPELDPGPVQRGPFPDAPSTAHPVAYSELHTTARACAWCHEYVNPEGTMILGTYSEWQSSSARAEGRTCQSCHMGLSAKVNLHHVPGGHSLDQLHRALGLYIGSSREGDELTLEITLFNKGAGHAVPTGMPGRRVILHLRVTSQGQPFEERRVYGRFFEDAAGKTIRRDSDYFSPGVKQVSDSRILPDERRVEVFRFPVRRDGMRPPMPRPGCTTSIRRWAPRRVEPG